MTTTPDPRALVRQAQLQTQANRYAKLLQDSGTRLINKIVNK